MVKLQKDVRLRQLYMSYFDDGILDLFVGWIVFFAGLMLFTELIWMAGVYVAIFLPTVWSIKEKVTMPRLRQEELSLKMANRSTNLLIAFLIAGLLILLLGLTGFFLVLNPDQMPITKGFILYGSAGLIAATVLGGFILVGSIHQAPRWYVYAAVATIIAALAWGLQIGLPWVLMAIGAMMTMTGSVFLVRFLHRHPILPEDERAAW